MRLTLTNFRQHLWHGLSGLLFVLFLIYLSGPKLINAPQIDPDHPFDTQVTLERLTRILGDEAPHPVDSEASDAVIERLLGEIRALGFDPEVDDAFHCSRLWLISCARVRNIGFWVTEPGPDAVMVASHHDSVPTGPGAADDGMGVAASLEIARLMKDRDLTRPLYILMTDGEEVGLVGASRFVTHNPVAPLIGAVVSMEARGNRGPASMFETSAPNGRDLAALKPHPEHRVKGPVASSLSVDIYRAMPNGTDVTEYLKLDMDAANYAMTGHESHYHTAHDDLEHLNPASVFHVGVSALSAVEGFTQISAETSDAPKIYADMLGRGVIALPRGLAQPLIALAFLLCALALFQQRDQKTQIWRVLLFPLMALGLGTGLAILAGMSVSALRPESAHGTAFPIALRGLFLSLALVGAAITARWLYRPTQADHHLLGSWAVLMLVGLAASFFFFGASVLFALPALFLIPAVGLSFVDQHWARYPAFVLFGLAGLVTLIMGLTLYVMAETALFVETSAPLTALMIWVFIVTLPLVWRRDKSTRWPIMGMGLTALVFGAASLIVPAYSEDAPLGTNLIHVGGDGKGGPHFAMRMRDPVPETMTAISPFARGFLENIAPDVWMTPAPDINIDTEVEILADEWRGGARTLELQIQSPEADMIHFFISGRQKQADAIEVNGIRMELPNKTFRPMECAGRACRDLQIRIEGLKEPASLYLNVNVTRYGLDDASAALISARPDWMGPQHDGDRRIFRVEMTLPAHQEPME